MNHKWSKVRQNILIAGTGGMVRFNGYGPGRPSYYVNGKCQPKAGKCLENHESTKK
jgi:hypothetical protein